MRIRLLVVSSFFVGWLVSIFSFAASNCEPMVMLSLFVGQ